MDVKENNEPIMVRGQNEAETTSEISPLTADTREVRSNLNLEGIARISEEHVENTTYGTVAVRPVNQTPGNNFILLGIFCCLAFVQNSVFVEWNPIANSALAAFGPEWSPSTLAWQINLATITSPIIQWPVWIAIQKYDLSRTIRWGAVFPIFVSATISYIPLAISNVDNFTYKWLTYSAYVFTGITGVVFFSSITRFSRVWFPQDQRATSTGLLCTFANLGGLLPAIVGPIIVTEPDKRWLEENHNGKDIIKHQIQSYLLIYFVLTCLLLSVYLLYFPRDTDSKHYVSSYAPESRSAPLVTDHEQSSWNVVWRNFIAVVKQPSLIFIMLLQSLSTLPHIWGTTLLTVTLSPLGVSQKTIGMLIIITTIASFITTILSTRLADMLFRFRLKGIILILLTMHTVAMICVSVSALSHGHSDSNKYTVFAGYVFGISFLNSAAPLIYELLAEVSHPVPEDVINGLCNQCNNIVGVLFYLTFR